MTSGTFTTVDLDSIVIDRGARQRKTLTDVDVLAESINRLGLIHPPVITRDLVLVAGERRVMACRLLGWTHVPIQFEDEESPEKHRAIELEENVKRVDLPWAEHSKAINDYHNLRRAEMPEWTLTDTAAALGYDKRSISLHLSVGKEIAAGNTKISSAPKFSTAVGIVTRAAARRDEKALADLAETLDDGPEAKPAEAIINTDFLAWAGTYTGPKFNFIHCDFPYGIEASNQHQGGAVATHGSYDDSEATYWALCDSLLGNLDRLCGGSCHFMFWFSMHFYARTLVRFADAGVELDPFPLVWLKSDNIGLLPDPQRGPRRIYETCLFGSYGDRKIVRAVSNAYSAPTSRERHMSEKPEPVLKHFFQMFVDDSTLMLDPTCGSGTSVRAAEAMGASYVIGVEKDTEFADGARSALVSARALRSMK